MAEPKWTPGPWTASAEPDSYGCFLVTAPSQFGIPWHVAESFRYCGPEFKDGSDREHFNALLIAAAPDLDDACQPEALVALAGRARQNGCPGLAGELLLIAAKQRAAKAKARGEVTS